MTAVDDKTTRAFAIPGTADTEQIADLGAFFAKVVASSIAGVYVYDLQTQHNVYINEQYTRLTGYTLAEINAMGPAFVELFHPEERRTVDEHMRSVQSAADGDVTTLEYRFQHKSGNWTWMLSHDIPFERDASGVVSRFLGSFVDITHQKRVQEDLEHFAHIAAHDLRAPARRIKLACSMLSKAAASLPESDTTLLSVVQREADQMLDLIRGLRALTTVGHTGALQRQRVPLEAIARSAVDEAREAIDAKHVHIEFDPLPDADVHQSLVRTVYRNLLGNALAHGSDGMTVRFTASQVGSDWVLGVLNTGSTIDPALAGEVFAAFRRFGEHAGTGMGLAICRRIVDFHAGSIWIEPGAQSVHVRFTLGGA